MDTEITITNNNKIEYIQYIIPTIAYIDVYVEKQLCYIKMLCSRKLAIGFIFGIIVNSIVSLGMNPPLPNSNQFIWTCVLIHTLYFIVAILLNVLIFNSQYPTLKDAKLTVDANDWMVTVFGFVLFLWGSGEWFRYRESSSKEWEYLHVALSLQMFCVFVMFMIKTKYCNKV